MFFLEEHYKFEDQVHMRRLFLLGAIVVEALWSYIMKVFYPHSEHLWLYMPFLCVCFSAVYIASFFSKAVFRSFPLWCDVLCWVATVVQFLLLAGSRMDPVFVCGYFVAVTLLGFCLSSYRSFRSWCVAVVSMALVVAFFVKEVQFPVLVFVSLNFAFLAFFSAFGYLSWRRFEFLVKARDSLREQKAQVLNSAQLAALGEMAGGIAHEINTPLMVILGRAQQIYRQVEMDPADTQKLKTLSQSIEATAQRISSVVRALRYFSRDGSGEEVRSVNISRLLSETLSLCRERFQASGVRLELGMSNLEEVFLECREVQISQVLLNLLSNAFDAAVTSEQAWVRVEVEADEQKVLFVVTDSGSGVELVLQSKIFEPFFTTKEEGQGTGLGLSISRGIVEAHRGRLYLRSATSPTSFVMEIPR